MPNPLISIVVPIYNVERHILNCIESIVEQSYSNFEVILVNDGSQDNSAKICNEWIQKVGDHRFRIFNKSNGGLSDARNYGLKQCSANSEYVIFVDSDDELLPDCLSMLLKPASHSVLIIGTLLRCKKDSIPPISKTGEEIELHEIWHNIDFLNRLQFGIINSCCGNCYSLQVIRQNNIVFKHLLPEDTFFNIEYLSCVNDVVIITRPIYLYFIWGNSMSTKPAEEIYINYMHIQQSLYEMVDSQNRSAIDRFVYPQYRVNSMKFIKSGEYLLPRLFLGKNLIKQSMDSYKPVSIADWIVHFSLKHRLLRIAKLF